MSNQNFNPLWLAIIQAQRKKEEDERNAAGRAALLGELSQFYPSLLSQPIVVKRKVFISYHHGDDTEVKAFVKKWAETEKVFIPKGLGLTFTDDMINSTNPEYVMSQIREKYLDDSTVTIVLLGSCTHSRRYVDWEIKTSLRQGLYSSPNGLMGIVLPSGGNNAYLPSRLQENWVNGHVNCYARFWRAPTTATELRGWIEDAFESRTSRIRFIRNSQDMMKYNSKCNVCSVTH